MDTSDWKYSNRLPVRVDKTLQWLEQSRHSWGKKTKETKEKLKKQNLAVKRGYFHKFVTIT